MAASPHRKFIAQAIDVVAQLKRPTVEMTEEVTPGPAYEADKADEKITERVPGECSRLTELEAEVRRLQMENEFLRKAVLFHPGA